MSDRRTRIRLALTAIVTGAAVLASGTSAGTDLVEADRLLPPAESTSSTTAAPTIPPPAPTTTVPAAQAVWTADYETGDPSQWDGIWISGDAESTIVTSPTHSGTFANALTVFEADGNGESPGVRMTYQGRGLAPATDPENLPTEAYYGAWYLIPEFVAVDWWNIFQWKIGYDDGSGRTARALYWHDLDDYGDELYLELQTRVTPEGDWIEGWAETLAVSPVPVPIGTWFHLQSYYRWDPEGNGQVTTWLDGQQIWDVTGVTTEFDWPFDVYKREWTVNNYANHTNPATHTLYVDDAAITFAG